MLGAITGDVIGSVYEFKALKNKGFQPLFHADSFFTDDTVLTVAVADALLNERDIVESFKDWGRRYPYSGWGHRFSNWLFSDDSRPYGSYGNGAAMRVSPAAFLAGSLEEALESARRVTMVTHNHPEGVRGAEATATAVFLALSGESAGYIRKKIEHDFGYDLSRTPDEIRPTYYFNETCQGTVPEAIICALTADDFEDAVREAVSLGGDADTLGAITGSIAEAMYDLPPAIGSQSWLRLPEDMRLIVEQMYAAADRRLPVE